MVVTVVQGVWTRVGKDSTCLLYKLLKGCRPIVIYGRGG